jgi:hypothetical protein
VKRVDQHIGSPSNCFNPRGSDDVDGEKNPTEIRRRLRLPTSIAPAFGTEVWQ